MAVAAALAGRLGQQPGQVPGPAPCVPSSASRSRLADCMPATTFSESSRRFMVIFPFGWMGLLGNPADGGCRRGVRVGLVGAPQRLAEPFSPGAAGP